ncbi:MAG: AAA family ATPase [Candidatus Wallbacteria bacterium]|nr:AAA family ATPase [Candidatus Wallbacteria bacterium]
MPDQGNKNDSFRTDRSRDFEILRNRVNCTGCVFIVGLPGMGKSVLLNELAIHLQVEGKFPNQVSLIHCRNGWNAGDFYAAILDRLNSLTGKMENNGVEIDPQQIAERIDELPMALLIDDFQYVEDSLTRSLVEATHEMRSGKLIIASRIVPELGTLASAGVYTHILKYLDREESGSMVTRLLSFHGYEQGAGKLTEVLFRLTGGHPLLVKLLIGLVVSGKNTVRNLDLLEHAMQEKSEEYFNSMFWAGLDVHSVSLLRTFSLLRIPVNQDSILEMHPETDHVILASLRKQGLLEFDLEGNYWMHDVLRQFVSHKMTQAEISKLHGRIGESLHSAGQASMEMLREAYYQFVRSGKLDRAAQMLVELVEVNHLTEDQPQDLLPLLRDAIETLGIRSEELNYAYVKQLAMLNQDEAEKIIHGISGWRRHDLSGVVCYNRSDFPHAREHFEKALACCDSEKNRLLARLQIAICLTLCGDNPGAENILKSMAQERLLEENEILKIKFYCWGSVIKLYTEKPDEALDYARKAEILCRKNRTESLLNIAIGRQGVALCRMGEYPEAERLMLDGLEMGQRRGNLLRQLGAYSSLGYLKVLTRNYEEALDYENRALEISLIVKDSDYEFDTHAEKGYLFTCLQRFAEAEAAFEQAKAAMIKLNNSYYGLLFIIKSSPFLLAAGQADKAISEIMQVSDSLDRLSPSSVARVKYCLFKAFQLTNRQQEAEKTFREFQDLLSKLTSGLDDGVRRYVSDVERLLEQKRTGICVLCNGVTRRFAEPGALRDLRQRKMDFEIFIDFTESELLVDGKPVDLFGKTILVSLLFALARKPGRIIGTPKLFEQVWKRKFDYAVDGNNFRPTILRLRKKLGDEKGVRFILTSHDRGGYYFNSSVKHCIIFKE